MPEETGSTPKEMGFCFYVFICMGVLIKLIVHCFVFLRN